MSNYEKSLVGDVRSFIISTFFLGLFLFWHVTGVPIGLPRGVRVFMLGFFWALALMTHSGYQYSRGYLEGWRVGVREGEAGVHMESWRRWFRALLWLRSTPPD